MASIGAHQVLKSLSKLFNGGRYTVSVDRLYENVMEQALSPALYETGMTTDTFDGRFEAVTIFSSLVMRRLREFGSPGEHLADRLYRAIFAGFDHALRERGTGDSSIARKIRGYGERFFGLARAIDSAISAENSAAALDEVLIRNDIGGDASPQLVSLLINCEAVLCASELESFESGAIDWPTIEG